MSSTGLRYDYAFNPEGDSTAARIVRQVGYDKSVLELGCGPGAITRVLKEHSHCDVFAIEVDAQAAKVAAPWCSQIEIASLDDPAWVVCLQEKRFDVLVLADVLEHLRDPVGVLKVATQYLKTDGYVVISLPNVAHNGIVAALLQQSFPYRDTGLLDNTHIRFFARDGLDTLLKQAGLFKVHYEEIKGAPQHTEFAAAWFGLTESQRQILEQNAGGYVYQFLITAVPDIPENQHRRPLLKQAVSSNSQHPDARNLMRLLHEQALYYTWRSQDAEARLQSLPAEAPPPLWRQVARAARRLLWGHLPASVAHVPPLPEPTQLPPWGNLSLEKHIQEALQQYNEPMPCITLVLDVGDAELDDPALQQTVYSIQQQTYINYQLLFSRYSLTSLMSKLNGKLPWDSRWNAPGQAEHTNNSLADLVEFSSGEIVLILAPGDQLHATALQAIARVFSRTENIQLLTFNHCTTSKNFALPGWCHEFHFARNVVGRAVAFKRDALLPCKYLASSPYLVMLALWSKVGDQACHHLARELFKHKNDHWATSTASHQILEDTLQKRYPEATLQEGSDASLRIMHSLPLSLPLISILIPTRNAAHLVEVCINSLLAETRYPNFEILLIDNGSDDPHALSLFDDLARRDPRITVLRDETPFNFSRLNNRAARQAKGDFLLLLNNDTEIMSSDWLDQMMRYAINPENGAVGARLWYPDHTLQHGGVVVKNGSPQHEFTGFGPEQAGPLNRARLTQRYLAVTAACLLVRKAYYWQVGGLDEGLAVAFNDVDFCFRLHASGYRNIWVAEAELIHHESPSRGRDLSPEKRSRATAEYQRLRDRWTSLMKNDPYYVC